MHEGVSPPASIDWRKNGTVTPVKNQAQVYIHAATSCDLVVAPLMYQCHFRPDGQYSDEYLELCFTYRDGLSLLLDLVWLN